MCNGVRTSSEKMSAKPRPALAKERCKSAQSSGRSWVWRGVAAAWQREYYGIMRSGDGLVVVWDVPRNRVQKPIPILEFCLLGSFAFPRISYKCGIHCTAFESKRFISQNEIHKHVAFIFSVFLFMAGSPSVV